MIIDEELDIKKYNSEGVREEFANLAAQWTQDVEGISSTVEMVNKHG